MASHWIPLNIISHYRIINTKGGVTPTQIQNIYKPDYFINGGQYARDSMQNITYMMHGGTFDGHLFSDEMLVLGTSDNPAYLDVIHKDTVRASTTISNAISGAPLLVYDGKPDIRWGNFFSASIAGPSQDNMTLKAFRSLIGFNSDYLIMCSTDKPVTIPDLASIAVNQFHLKYAFALDGGGSCHLQKSSTPQITSYRANVSWILIYLDTGYAPVQPFCPTCGQPLPPKK